MSTVTRQRGGQNSSNFQILSTYHVLGTDSSRLWDAAANKTDTELRFRAMLPNRTYYGTENVLHLAVQYSSL